MKILLFTLVAAAVLVGALDAAGTRWALAYALACFVAIFGWDRLLGIRDRIAWTRPKPRRRRWPA